MRPLTMNGWTATVLGILLAVTNVWWLYLTFDNAITSSLYHEDQMGHTQRALDDALSLIPLLDAAVEKTEWSHSTRRPAKETE